MKGSFCYDYESVQLIKCIIVSHYKNMLTQRNVDGMYIVYFNFFGRNYHCCPFHLCILQQKYFYIQILLSKFCEDSFEHREFTYKFLWPLTLIQLQSKDVHPTNAQSIIVRVWRRNMFFK